MIGAVQTGCFVMAAVGAYYLLAELHIEFGKIFVRTGVIVGVIAALLQLFPTGDGQGMMIAQVSAVTLAAMEGLFHHSKTAPARDPRPAGCAEQRLDNPLIIPSC